MTAPPRAQRARVRRVAVIAAPPVSMFNLAIPEMLFGKVEIDGAPEIGRASCRERVL